MFPVQQFPTPTCSTCRHQPPRIGQRTCGSCHAKYQRLWRKKKADAAKATQREVADLRALINRIREPVNA